MANHRARRFNRRRHLPVAVVSTGTVAALVFFGGHAVANAKTVDVNINGRQLQVTTTAATVEDVLGHAGAPDQATVEPPREAPVTDGTSITVRTNRSVDVVIDGDTSTHSTTALTVEELLEELGVDPASSVDTPGQTPLPESGLTVRVTTPKTVNLTDGTRTISVTVPAETVADVLTRSGIILGAEDTVTPSPEQEVTDGSEVTVTRITTTVFTETTSYELEPVISLNPAKFEDEETVLVEGASGTRRREAQIVTINDVAGPKTVTVDEILVPAVAAHIERGTKPHAPAVPMGSKWDKLAFCESTNTWNINTGNGFSGGLQFTPSTWTSFGGGKYAPMAWQATREEQIDIAEKVLAVQGWGAWPACTRKLGYR